MTLSINSLCLMLIDRSFNTGMFILDSDRDILKSRIKKQIHKILGEGASSMFISVCYQPYKMTNKVATRNRVITVQAGKLRD